MVHKAKPSLNQEIKRSRNQEIKMSHQAKPSSSPVVLTTNHPPSAALVRSQNKAKRLKIAADLAVAAAEQAAREVESLAANEAHETSAMAQREALELKLTIEKAAMRLEMLTGERGTR